MRLLLDQNLSPLLVELLGEAAYNVVHVQSFGLHAATDREILQTALVDDRVIISADTDSGDLLASSNAPGHISVAASEAGPQTGVQGGGPDPLESGRRIRRS